jgi:hypothetical protein
MFITFLVAGGRKARLEILASGEDGNFWGRDLVETQGEFSLLESSDCFPTAGTVTPFLLDPSLKVFSLLDVLSSVESAAATSWFTFLALVCKEESTMMPIEIFRD